MTDTTITQPPTATSMADRVFESVLGALDVFAIYMGNRLGAPERVAAYALGVGAGSRSMAVRSTYGLGMTSGIRRC